MSAALLLFALGMPCLPEELGHVAPPPTADGPAVPSAPTAAPQAPAPRPSAVAKVTTTPTPTSASSPARASAARPMRGSQESSLYRVAYGLLGQLGQIQIAFTTRGNSVRAQGLGTGSMFGLANYEKRIESHLDSRGLTASRWIAYRAQGGRTVTDIVAQPRPGAIAVHRRRTGKPDEQHQFARQQAVLDPLTFLYNLRVAPPRASRSFEVLDGRALWEIAVEPAQMGTLDNRRPALVLRGRARPIEWDGRPDDERTARSFTLWLDTDQQRTPLRLVMPLAVGEVRVDLTGTIVRPTVASAKVSQSRQPVPSARAAAPGRPAAASNRTVAGERR